MTSETRIMTARSVFDRLGNDFIGAIILDVQCGARHDPYGTLRPYVGLLVETRDGTQYSLGLFEQIDCVYVTKTKEKD